MPFSLPSHPPNKIQSNNYSNNIKTDAEIPSTTISTEHVPPTSINISVHRSRNPQRNGNTIVHDRIDQTRRNTLMFPCRGIAENDRARGETHVHSPGHDDDRDEGLGPVDLGRGSGGDEDLADEEEESGEEEDVADFRLGKEKACCDGS